MVYSEDIVNVDVAHTITWLPTSKGHNVEFVAGPPGATLPKKSKMNKEFSHTFDTPGIYYYVCTPHKSMGMIGLVVVGGDQKVVLANVHGVFVASNTASSLDAVMSILEVT